MNLEYSHQIHQKVRDMNPAKETMSGQENTPMSEGVKRAYSMLFWFLGGSLGCIAGTAIIITELFPGLTSREAFLAIWCTAIPLAILVNILGWFATKNRRIRNWSITGFVLLFILMRLASYVIQFLK